eukprot:gnl/Dysnectes_brevis/1045_a1165_4117.p1 GENE.gnl/Dysnectes_brevis/1045_a1165_4117~~gnl/Dysnectes_brevis/1045_a1165_4117.p1  ORF type:complete len:184 (+),score=20.04 gnl/Dysnectes_brevis/1045_a1165_4117:40-552(+)
MSSTDAGCNGCPLSSSFWPMMGCAASIIFSSIGSAYGTAKSGVAIGTGGIIHPAGTMKNTLSVIMSSVISIYGLITVVVIIVNAKDTTDFYSGFAQFAGGLCTGLTGLASGLALGVSGVPSAKGTSVQPALFVASLQIMVFASALSIYGLIMGLLLAMKKGQFDCTCWPY